MIQRFRQFFGLAGDGGQAAVPPGQRVYAVGDVHGRLDLFEALIEAIEQDDSSGITARTTVVLLGDLVDRGPDSAAVIERARAWQQQRAVRILAGNHEEMFLESFAKVETLRHFLRFGGRETLLSYGIEPAARTRAECEALQALMRERIPAAHLEFLRGFEDLIVIGEYLFAHAGIAPDVPLADQSPKDLRWIREPFLSHAEPHSHIVVHGHTISDSVDVRANRIGIDTGAYASGCLTALVLEGTGRRFIETKVNHGVVTAQARRAVP